MSGRCDYCGEVPTALCPDCAGDALLMRERDEARADRDGFDADRIALALQNDKLHAEVERLRAALTRIESLSETLSEGPASAEECLKEIACAAYVALAEDSGPGGEK